MSAYTIKYESIESLSGLPRSIVVSKTLDLVKILYDYVIEVYNHVLG